MDKLLMMMIIIIIMTMMILLLLLLLFSCASCFLLLLFFFYFSLSDVEWIEGLDHYHISIMTNTTSRTLSYLTTVVVT